MTRSRVLITGATGFIGSHIAEAFVRADYLVRCAFRRTSRLRWLDELVVQRMAVDFDDPASLYRVLEGVDTVIHAAGITRAPDAETYRQVNTAATLDLAVAARAQGVRRFVFISSLAARGPDQRPEPGDHPISAYGESKLEAENELRALEEDLEVVVLRPATVYGPRDLDVLPVYQMALRGFVAAPTGRGAVQFVFASDVAAAALAAATSPASFGPFPVSEPTVYSWEGLADILRLTLGRSVRVLRFPPALFTTAARMSEGWARLRGTDPMFDVRRARDISQYSYTCDPSTTRERLGWCAEMSLVDGARHTAAWYRERGWL